MRETGVKKMALIANSMTLALGILLIGGSLIYVFKGVLERETDYAGFIAIILVLVAAALLLTNFPDVNEGKEVLETFAWSDTLGDIGFRLDSVSYPITFAVVLLGVLATIYAFGYVTHEHSKPSYWANQVTFIGGMLGVCLATNLVEFYIFWEIMLVPSYFLILYWGTPAQAKRISMKYFLFTHAGAVLIIIGFALTYDLAGTFDMRDLAQALTSATPAAQTLRMIFLLLIIGFAVKMAVFPVHTWLPDAHAEAPTPISMLLSGVMIETGAYAFLRFGGIFFNKSLAWYSQSLALMGVATMWYGGIMALVQTDLKRLLAYSSVSQMGYIFFGLSVATFSGFAGSLTHIIAHTCGKGLLFGMAGVVMHETGFRDLNRLGGLSSKMPYTATAAVIGALSIAGAPPLFGFQSEWLIFRGGFEAGFTVLTLAAVLSTIVSAGYMLRLLWKVFLGPLPEHLEETEEGLKSMVIPLTILAAVIVILGIWPSFVHRVIVEAAKFVTAFLS